MDSRFQRKLRPIAAVTLFFFSWISIEPWNYAAWAQTLPKPKASVSQPSKNSAGKFEESLRAAKKVVEDLDQDVASGKDITLQLESLKGHKQTLEAADPAIRAEFAATDAFLNQKKLPKTILDRHAKVVKEYEANLKTLSDQIDALSILEAERKQAERNNDRSLAQIKEKELQARIKSVQEQLKAQVREPRHQPSKPSEIPNRTRELRPLKTSWLKPVMDWLIPSAYAAEPPPPGPADLAETLETPQTQEIHDLAVQLGSTPVALFEFVRNNFKYEPYVGSVKGATQTLKEKAGNEWDQASLLIALFRASGIPARYVVGTVEIPVDQAMSWLGVEDANVAASLLYTQGRPTSLIYAGGKISAIRSQQVWVSAYVPFLHSRGATTGPGDTWVDMDPSMKTQTATQTLNLAGAPVFDSTAYLSTFRTQSPLDFYKGQLQTFLDTNAPSYIPEALARNLEITPEYLGILVGQPPYTIKSVTATYTEIPDTARQKFTLNISDPITGANQLAYTAPMPQMIGKRLTLSYAPATSTDQATITAYGTLYGTPPYLIQIKPQIKLEGVVVAEGAAIGSGKDQGMTFVFDTTIGIEQVNNTVIAGEYYAIALNPQVGSGSHEQVSERSQRLAAIQDTIHLNDPTTLDDRLGELLYLTAEVYQHNLNMGIRQIVPLHGVVDIRDVSEMMFFLTVQVDEVFGVPKKITPVGITGDMDRDTHLVIPVNGDLNRIKPFMTLEGHQSSYLEHSVTEGVYQTDAISAVKGIQLAHDQGIPVHTINKQNITTELPLLQLSQDVESEIQNAANAGKEVIVPERNLTLFDWTGVGYIIQNPDNGEGAYRISGGVSGVGIVREALIRDLLVTVLDQIASQARGATEKLKICFPGPDNRYYTFPSDDVCYTEVTFEEISQNELQGCQNVNDPGCRKKYAVSHTEVSRPLIDTQEHGLTTRLTKNVNVLDWQSQDNARYMRAGFAVLATIEVLMDFFQVTKHDLRPAGAGYRTTTRNASVGGSETSHHPDGVAADVTLADPIAPAPTPKKCEVLAQALFLIGGNGEVLAEKPKQDGTPKTSVHMAIPGISNNDRATYPSQWRCQ